MNLFSKSVNILHKKKMRKFIFWKNAIFGLLSVRRSHWSFQNAWFRCSHFCYFTYIATNSRTNVFYCQIFFSNHFDKKIWTSSIKSYSWKKKLNKMKMRFTKNCLAWRHKYKSCHYSKWDTRYFYVNFIISIDFSYR